MSTPLFIPATYNDGPNSNAILIPFVDTLPLRATTNRALILDQDVGPSIAGLYVYDDTETWRFSMPIEAVSAVIVQGDAVGIYVNASAIIPLVPTSIVYKNGQLQVGHEVDPDSAVYAVRFPNSASLGGVTSINGLFGDVTLDASNIEGFADVAYSGLYSDLIGAPGAYTLPVAGVTVLGGVIVPLSSKIKIDGAGNIDLDPAVITQLNNAITNVVSSGTGNSLIRTVASGTATLKSIAAGANITVTDDGNGTLTVASTASGSGNIVSVGSGNTLIDSSTSTQTALRSLIAGSNVTITYDNNGGLVFDVVPAAAPLALTGDVVGNGTGTVNTTLSNTGVVAGTYTKVTVDAKGRVTLGINATTLADYGITDALPLIGGTMTGNILMSGGHTITGVPNPVNPLDAVNKQSLDAALADAANGVSWRAAVVAATTGNIALTGLQTIDGRALIAGDRALVKNQTTPTQNGVYDVASGAWTRSTDSDTGAELFHAAYLIINGTTNALTQWANTNVTAPVIGTDAISFGQLKGASNVYTGGTGIAVTGLAISIADVITPGTFSKVTVNAQGQVVAGFQLTSADVTTALTYTPYNGTTNPQGFISGNQTVTLSGDVTGSGMLSGTIASVLTASGVVAGTYTKVTVDSKGRVTLGANLSNAEIVAALGFTPVNKAGDTMTGVLNNAPIAIITAAATTPVGSANTNNVNVVGTTTITAFDTAPSGSVRTVRFAGILTLTNSGSLVLPSGANIITAVGDTAQFTSNGAGWLCNYYTRANGQALVTGSGSPYTTTQEFDGSATAVAAKFKNIVEIANIIAAAPAATQNFYVSQGAVQVFTPNATANWIINFAYDAVTPMNTALAVGESVTVSMWTPQGVSGFFPTAFRIDGVAVTPKWQNGTPPVGGNPSSTDVYTFTILKTAASTYNVLAAQTQFK